MALHQLSSLPPLETDHRKLLEQRPPEDSQSTDNASDDAVSEPDQVDVLEVSISRAQTYMRSPQTPAVEKQRALEQYKDYFAQTDKPEIVPEIEVSNPEQMSSTPPMVSPWTAHPCKDQTTAFATVLNDAKTALKRRSRSSSNMFDNLMRMLPDLPSFPSLKSQPFFSGIADEEATRQSTTAQRDTAASEVNDDPPENQDPNSGVDPDLQKFQSQKSGEKESDGKLPDPDQTEPTRETIARAESVRSTQSKRHSDPSVLSPTVSKRDVHLGLDGSVESMAAPTNPAGSRLRRSSESSLYLSRRFSGASAFDDTSAFAHVSDMANSRFKAITDSFASSTLRFPRLPKQLKPAQGKNKGLSDETSRNTELNARHAHREHEKVYTNLHNIKKSKKLPEVETYFNRAHPIFFDALDEMEGDLIVMGGYRGSILREAKSPHRQLWAPVKVGLNLRKADLEIGLNKEDEERAEEKIIPSGVLSHIGPIDICRRLLKHSRKCPNAKSGKLRIHDWGYDWRLSPHLLAGRLIKFLEGLDCNQPHLPANERGCWMIAHSLGGLITRYVVNIRPELFAGVLYAGTPMNCVNILGPLRNGDNVLLSQKVLTAQVNFTIRTSFALLPEDGRLFFQKDTNERIDLDFFDPQTWEDHHLSPCIKQAIPPPSSKQRERSKSLVGMMAQSVTNLSRPSLFAGTSDASKETSQMTQTSDTSASTKSRSTSSQNAADTARQTVEYAEHLVADPAGDASVEPSMSNSSHKPSAATTSTLDPTAAREYLARTLADTLAFKRALAHKPDMQSSNRYPPHALMYGKTVPTVYGAKVVSKEAIKWTNCFDDLAFAAGDGVVLASAAQLPEGYRVVKGGRISSDRGHVGLMGDLEGVGMALKALFEGRRKGVGMGCYDNGNA